MEKRISPRNYARMSPNQCLKNYKPLLLNAGVKYRDAVHLAEKESYGTAISLMILSIEETMKAFVLYLDGHGFLFRNIKGVSNIFVNHKLRYPLAMIISIISSFGRDIVKLAEEYAKKPEEKKLLFDRFKNDRIGIAEALIKYLKQKSDEMRMDVQWFSNVGLLREDGLYVDGTKTPADITKEHFDHVKERVDLLNGFSSVFFGCMDHKDKEFQKEIAKFRDDFKSKDYYGMIGRVVAKFNDKQSDPFNELILEIEKFKQQLSEFPDKLIPELKQDNDS